MRKKIQSIMESIITLEQIGVINSKQKQKFCEMALKSVRINNYDDFIFELNRLKKTLIGDEIEIVEDLLKKL